jgi:hypothetical protein
VAMLKDAERERVAGGVIYAACLTSLLAHVVTVAPGGDKLQAALCTRVWETVWESLLCLETSGGFRCG